VSRVYSQTDVPDHACGYCGETSWGAVKWFHSNGSDHRKIGCMNCRATRVLHPDDVPAPDMFGEVNLNAAPSVSVPLTKAFGDYLGVFMVESEQETQLVCRVRGCTEKQVEMHHYAPKKVFGWRAEDYGTVPLCKTHHDEWHDALTDYWQKMKQGSKQ
jgi:hypothetical protein